MYTIVTAFFDIGREHWPYYRRSVQQYLQNAQRTLSLDDYMVIYTEPQYLEFVAKHRQPYPHKTQIVCMTLQDLPYFKYRKHILDIMLDANFQKDLVEPICPEVRAPFYDVIMWSKVPLVVKTLEENPFNTTHFVWLDFGIHAHMLQESMLSKPLLNAVPDKIKLLCCSYPISEDLDIQSFYKAHAVRLVGAIISGKGEAFRTLYEYLEEEIQNAFAQRVVGSDQSLLTVIFLKHPELFQLHYGDFPEVIINYYQVVQNRDFIWSMALSCKNRGDIEAFEEISRTIADK